MSMCLDFTHWLEYLPDTPPADPFGRVVRTMPQTTIHKLGPPRRLTGEGNTWDVIWALQVNGIVHQVQDCNALFGCTYKNDRVNKHSVLVRR